MHPYRITVLLITCGLVLGGLASPAAAKTIVVTTLTDTADPPFKADGACGTGTVGNLPGADRKVSLREAIIAANNTKGKQTITFAPRLSGGAIRVNFDDLDADADPDPLPTLCGEHTRIKGDLNGDDTPDITLEGGAFPAASFAAGIRVISSHNTITGLRVRHFPFGIAVIAGLTGPETVKHTTVKNNIVAESTIDGIIVLTGDAPGSVLAHTTITHNLVRQNARLGISVFANLSAAGADTRITQTTITDNKVRRSGAYGIYVQPQGAHNRVTDLTIARNTVSGAAVGISTSGGFNGADHNTFDVDIKDNLVTNNSFSGIDVLGGGSNSSNNRVVARIRGNTVERNQGFGITATGGFNDFPGASNNNVLAVWIERNTVRNHREGTGILVNVGAGEPSADGNQAQAIVKYNVVEGNAVRGIALFAGGPGMASDNALDVRVAHNTVCNNGTDIVGEGGFSGSVLNPTPNLGTGNELTGKIFHNTATTVTVQDGIQNGIPENTADVIQFHNEPCP